MKPITLSFAVIALGAASAAGEPRPKESGYPGRSGDAPWRKAALRRIEKVRKADLVVRVTDAGGKPLPGARVNAAMTRHAFGFGTAINHWKLFDERDPAGREKYRAAVRKHFNKAVIENGHKWNHWGWENPESRKLTLAAVKWLRDAGIEVRGHCILWPSWRHMPKRVKGLAGDKEALRAEIRKRIADVVTANKSTLTEWDVVNEANTNHDVMDILGREAMIEWFQLARKADPSVQLFLNDYSILNGRHVPGCERWVRMLLDGGAPIGGIGIQGHLGAGSVPPEEMLKVLDRMAKLGLPLEITELDAFTADRELQADYLRDVLIVMFSHPAVEGVIMWGFWDGAHWKRNALLYNRDWTLKPSGAEWDRLIFKAWWTKAGGSSDAKGGCTLRGFLGEYEVTASHAGKSRTVKTALGKKGTVVEVKLD
jgi:endo-1,4-beta-xylanase